jgi:hypothetical protein
MWEIEMFGKTMMAAAVALVALPAAVAASECRTGALAGTWVLGSGSALICEMVVRSNGRFVATCPVLPDDGSPGSFSGRLSLNAGCIVRGLIGDEVGIEGRAWATSTPARIDAFQVVLGWKVEEDVRWLMAGGHRRPNLDPLPLQ